MYMCMSTLAEAQLVRLYYLQRQRGCAETRVLLLPRPEDAASDIQKSVGVSSAAHD